MVQVGLDGALWPARHRGDLPDLKAGVVVEQDRGAQPRRQCHDQRPHVHLLRLVIGGPGGGTNKFADRALFSAGFAPVVADQVGGDHVQVAVGIVYPGPAAQQPGERLGGDVMRVLVGVNQPPDPAG